MLFFTSIIFIKYSIKSILQPSQTNWNNNFFRLLCYKRILNKFVTFEDCINTSIYSFNIFCPV